jgi:RNA polymerase primary sigma factor
VLEKNRCCPEEPDRPLGVKLHGDIGVQRTELTSDERDRGLLVSYKVRRILYLRASTLKRLSLSGIYLCVVSEVLSSASERRRCERMAKNKTLVKSAPSEPIDKSVLRKLTPTVKTPAAAFMRGLSADAAERLNNLLLESAECVFQPAFRTYRSDCADMLAVKMRPDAVRAGGSDDELSEFSVLSPGPTEVLTAAEERELFFRFNYCRFRIMRILKRHAGARLTAEAARELLCWDRAADHLRAEIVRMNVSLVLAMARRSRIHGVELSDLVSEGNLALLRCVDKFDFARGFKFSTYACRAILSAFVRAATKASRYRSQVNAVFEPELERSDFLERRRESIQDDCVAGLKSILETNLAELNAVERNVITARFALDAAPSEELTRGRTLEQVGELLGVSKERVRQIQNKALAKLKGVLERTEFAAS